MNLEQVVADLAQKIERRYFGKYRGFVVENSDPEQLGRVKLRVPSILGSEVVTGWALPCAAYGGTANQGMLFIPEVGAGVWVEFEEGDLEFPIWVGTFWSKPGGESELPLPREAQGSEGASIQDPPTAKIIKTGAGHTLQLEDAEGGEMVLIVEGAHNHVITLDQNGIHIKDGVNNHEILLDGTGITVSDGVNAGNSVLLDAQGVTLSDKSGNSLAMNSSCGYPGGPGMDLNGGTRVCLEGLVQWLLQHQHVGNMGAPTPLFPANLAELQLKTGLPGGGILSDTVKAK